MREWWWRFRYAAYMWRTVEWLSWGDAWEAAWAMDFEFVSDCSPAEAADEELSYWTE